jgi:hypothetical protein
VKTATRNELKIIQNLPRRSIPESFKKEIFHAALATLTVVEGDQLSSITATAKMPSQWLFSRRQICHAEKRLQILWLRGL